MDIQHTMLGLLNLKPMTGYDIKKVMQKSPLTYWTGNNSQIYRTLAELQSNGFVTAEVLHDEASPTKKRYSITPLGRQELLDLSRSFPELPELRKPFLLQLAFGRGLSCGELESLLNQYEQELQGFLMGVETRVLPVPSSDYETAIQELLDKNIRQFYESEIAWVDKVRRKVLPLVEHQADHDKKENVKMEFATKSKNGQVYVTVKNGQIKSDQDGIELVSACVENGTNLLLLPASCLSDDFLRLSTRIAGVVLQKFANYNIKTAAVLDSQSVPGRFQEFLSESNHGKVFRAYATLYEAETWLLESEG